MKYKNFPQETWRAVNEALDQVLASGQRPVAVFDADGTLWDTDLGESFFKWQIQHNVLQGLPADPWRHYRDWKESGDPRPAYLWLAQINSGVSLQQVQAWAQEAATAQGEIPVFPEQRELIELLHKNGVEVFVVTASVKWAVEPGAQMLGISADHVLGVATEVKNGVVTDKQAGQITYREGKATALLEVTGGRKPFLASGNTLGDISLLQAATHVQLCVSAAKPDHELWPAEEKLRQEARKNHWIIHQF